MAVVAQVPLQRSKKTQPLIVRITHWVNAAAMVIMIGSGWRIFNDSPLIPGFIFHGDTYPLGTYVLYLPGAILMPVTDAFSDPTG